VSADLDLWTREAADLGPLLPRAEQWQRFDDVFEFAGDGDGWLLVVAVPEEADHDEIPPEFGELATGLRYRIGMNVEGGPGTEGWTFVRQTLESIGRALGGVGHDPESGHVRSWGASE
jgi:hypothetical protein